MVRCYFNKIISMSIRHKPGYMPWDRTGNRIIVHSELGRNKPTNYDIPDQSFVYGKVTSVDPEKANDLMYQWRQHHKSQNTNIGKINDLIATNKEALKHSVHTSSGNFEYRKSKTRYKSFKEGSNHIKINLPQESFTYGKPGDLQDPIKLLLANDYGQTDRLKRNTVYQISQSQVPKTKTKLSCFITKNHQLVKEATNKRVAMFQESRRDHVRDQWKMGKFRHALPKVDIKRKRFQGIKSVEDDKQEIGQIRKTAQI